MTINLSIPNSEIPDLKPRITVIGVGGAGGNAVNNMIASELGGVEFVVANTDAQSLAQSRADRRIQLGAALTQGLGAGARAEVGKAAAEETLEEILEQIKDSHMVFIAAGMGGGTGTGAAPVIARAAKEKEILTVGVVTKPFHFEGTHRMRIADTGISEFEGLVDTLIIIPNQNLFRVANEKTTFSDAFKMADNVLYSGVRGITDLMVMPGLINLDFADVYSVMGKMGKAMMGTGEADGERRALDAAESAISNPLLDDTSMKGARGVLINITGGPDMTLFEVDEAANRIRAEVDQDAYIIFGSTFDESLEGLMRVSVVATGIDGMTQPQSIDNLSDWAPRPEAASGPEAVVKPEIAAPEEERPAVTAQKTETKDVPIAASPLQALHAGFIPPAPADRNEASGPEAAGLFTEAGLAKTETSSPAPAKESLKPRGISLFERVTGANKLRETSKEDVSEKVAPPKPAPLGEARTAEPNFSGLGESGHTLPTGREGDLLEIPAFLRRQAN